MARSSSSSSGSSDQENSGGTIKDRSQKEKGGRSSSPSSEERKKKVQESGNSKVGNSRPRAGSPSIKKQRHKARSESRQREERSQKSTKDARPKKREDSSESSEEETEETQRSLKQKLKARSESREKEERSQKTKKDARLKKREDSSESSEEEIEESQRSLKQKHKARSDSRDKEERSQKPKKDSRLKKAEDSSGSSVEDSKETQRSWKNSSKLKAEEKRKFSPGRSRNQGRNRDTSPAKRSRTSPSRSSLDTRRNQGRERDISPGKRPRASPSRINPGSRRNHRRDRHTSPGRKPRSSPSINHRVSSPDKRAKDVTSSRSRSPVSRKLTSKEREKVSHKAKEDTRQKKRQDTSESSDEEKTDAQRPWKDSSRSKIKEKGKLSPHTRRDRGRDRDTSPGKRSRAVPTKNVRARFPSDRRIKERDASLSPRRSENHSVRRGQDQSSRKVDGSRRRQSPFGRISPDQTRQRRPAARRNESRSPRRDNNERRSDRSLQRGKQRHEPSDVDSAVEGSPPPTLREAETSLSPVRRRSPPPKSTDDNPQSSRKRRHHSDNSSDPGFSDTETKKRQRGEGSSSALVKGGSEDGDKTPVYKPRVYRDLDNPEPEPETLQRYWDVNVLAVPPTDTTPPRSRTPEQVGGRYWEPEPSEEQLKKELEEFRREKMKAKENAEKEKVELGEKKGDVEKEKPELKRKADDILTTRTGGAYIPPAKLRLMQQQISDKSSPAYQRLAWEALKKSIHGLINKINVSNIALIVRQLFKENIARGRGLLCRSIMQAQASSQTFSHVYAALVAVINTKFPNIGELLLKRLILQFKRGFKRNDKVACTSSAKFIAHLVNQQVAHELIALEILTLLLEKPTDDSVEIAIGFLKEVGMKLTEVSPRGLTAVFESLRHVLNEAALDKRVQYMIEVMYQVRKDGFKDNPAVMEELDLVEETDQMTHILSLEEVLPGASEDLLNVFKHDPDYVANEEKYDAVRKEILGDDEGSEDEGSGESGSGSEEGSDDEEGEEKKQTIIDETETNLTALRRTIYLTIQSSLDHNEAAHKLMRMQLKPGQEAELCNMILDCCAQQRTYEKFFGLLAQRFCQIKREYISPFEQLFRDSYDTIHRIDIGKLRNVAKLFAHLLFSDAISWDVLSHIHLNEDETTSSSRIFIKILFQELAEYMGLQKLNDRLKDATLQPYFEGIFPRDNPKHTRFSINFFTSIGLGGLTDTLREHLATMPKPTAIVPPIPKVQAQEEESGSSSDTSSSDSDSSGSDSSDSDSSTDSEVERRVRQRLKELRTREEEAVKRNKESDRDKNKKQREEEERRSRREKEKEIEKENRKRQEREEEQNRKRDKEREKERKREKEGRSDVKEKKKRDERRERPRKVDEKERSRRRRSES